jgi:DNA-binding transcriptional LysR family regulator
MALPFLTEFRWRWRIPTLLRKKGLYWHDIHALFERMDLETLRIFSEVARRGSFALVARDRDVDPSSVSRTIATLEDELRVRLLQRSTRRMTLTEAGAKYLSRIAPLIEEIDQARDEALAISLKPIGTLRLTTSIAFGYKCIAPILPKMREAFPELRVELLLTDINLDLVSEGIDLAVRLGPSLDTGLIGMKLFNTRYRVCVSPRYLEDCSKQGKSLRVPGDLAAHNCLLLNLPDYRSRWLFRDDAGTIEAVSVQGDIVISNPLVLNACAVDGMGPALLANWLVDEALADGTLVDPFSNYTVAASEFETAAWVLYPSRAYLPNKVRVMIDFLRKSLADRSRAS